MRIAVVGSGIAGNVVAHSLHREHEIVVFEAGDHVGGHTHTHSIEVGGETFAVDTGFIVFNDWTYPNFIRLLDELGVESQPSPMSFSVRADGANLEYNGTTLNSLFAQRRNLVRPSFYRMIRDILRFNREALELKNAGEEVPLGKYLTRNGYSRTFVDHYLVPMGAAIWSTSAERMLDFPARFFVRFFANHGMLSVDERPQWRVVKGGSARYVEKLTAPFRDRIRLGAAVESIRRLPDRVLVKARGYEAESFDHVFLACHSDQALALLNDPTPLEREVLGAFPYQENEAVLHTDTSLLPKRRRAWAAWNYHVSPVSGERVTLTYNMNILQSLAARETLCVTLNSRDEIDSAKILKRIVYHHPLFTPRGVAAQAQQHAVNCERTYYCGAYWRYGFHEDGVVSALQALDHFREHGHAQRSLSRVG